MVPGVGPPGGGPTLAQMVEMMPAGTLDDVKPGQTVVVSSTKGANQRSRHRHHAPRQRGNAGSDGTAQSGAGAAAANRPSGAGGPQGMPPGGMPAGMDLGGMLGGFGLSGMGP